MRRRSYLAVLGSLVSGGCVGGQSGSDSEPTPSGSATPRETPTPTETPSPTATPTGTPTPTETETPTPEPEPTAVQTNPVMAWDEYGDVEAERTSAFGAGAPVVIGSRHRLPTVDGKVDATLQCNVYEGEEQLSKDTLEITELVDTAGPWAHEAIFVFESETFERGSYSAEVLLRDDRFGTRVRTDPIEFEIVDPLTSGEVEIIEVDHPDPIKANEPFSMDIVLKNVSDRDSSIVSDHSVRRNLGEWTNFDDTRTANIAAGAEFVWERTDWELPRGEYTERLDALDLTWSFEVER